MIGADDSIQFVTNRRASGPRLARAAIGSILMIAATSGAMSGAMPASAAPYGSGWYGQVSAAASHIDNINGSYYDGDTFSDFRMNLQAGGGHLRKIGMQSQLTLSGYVGAILHSEYREVDALVASASVDFAHAFSLRRNAVWLSVRSEITRMDYRDSEGRDGWLWQSEAGLNRRLSDRLTGHAGVRYTDKLFPGRSDADKRRYAGFDYARGAAFAAIDVALSRDLFAYIEVERSIGDLSSNALDVMGMMSPPYEARSPDPAYRPCDDASCPMRWSYRVDTDVHYGEVGLVWRRGETLIDLAAGFMRGDAAGFPDYESSTVTLGISRNF